MTGRSLLDECIDVAEEPWSSVLPDCGPLAKMNKDEAVDRLVLPYDPDWQRLEALFKSSDNSIIITARFKGELVGYLQWTIIDALQTRGEKEAFMGPWYVLPELRGIGLRMWAKGLELLRERGIRAAYPHQPMYGRGKDLDKFFLRYGARPMITVYEMDLAS